MKTFALLTAVLLPLTTVSAEPLAKWDFTGENGSQHNPTPVSGSVPPSLEVSPLTRGEGFLATKGSPFTENSFTFSLVPHVNSLEEAIDKNAYFEVTITPLPGAVFSVDSISFSSKRASKNSGPNQFVVRTSLDDYSSDATGVMDTHPNELPEGGDIEVSFGGGLSNLTQPVTLRFYAFGRKQPDNPDGGLWAVGNSSTTGGFTIEGTVEKK